VSRADALTFSLPRLWAAVFVLLVLNLVLISSTLTGEPRLDPLFAMMPRSVAGAVFLFGPYGFAVLWVIVVALGIWFHRPRGLWLLLTGLLVVPATYLHWALVLGCVFGGRCL
jgi:hypothetical protein